MTSANGKIFRVTGPLCREFTDPGEFPAQRSVTRRFEVFFDLRLKKRLSKQSWGWWFEAPSCSLWRHCNVPRLFSLTGVEKRKWTSNYPPWLYVDLISYPFYEFSGWTKNNRFARYWSESLALHWGHITYFEKRNTLIKLLWALWTTIVLWL